MCIKMFFLRVAQKKIRRLAQKTPLLNKKGEQERHDAWRLDEENAHSLVEKTRPGRDAAEKGGVEKRGGIHGKPDGR